MDIRVVRCNKRHLPKNWVHFASQLLALTCFAFLVATGGKTLSSLWWPALGVFCIWVQNAFFPLPCGLVTDSYMQAVHADLAGLYEESARDIVLFQKTACQLVGDGRILTFQGIVFAIRRYESEHVRDLIRGGGDNL